MKIPQVSIEPLHSGYLNFCFTKLIVLAVSSVVQAFKEGYCVVCVFSGTGIQEGCQWATVVWFAHQKHLKQPGGAECKCGITSAGGQCKPGQNHVWPGQQFHTLHVLRCLLAFTAPKHHQHASAS